MRDDFPVVNRSRGPGLPPRRVHEIACSRCPATSTLSLTYSKSLPAHTVALKFAQRGWRVVGVGKHLCPACATTAARKPPAARLPAPSEDPAMPPKAAPKTTTPVMPAPAAANDDAAPAVPSADATASITIAYLLLGDHYLKARKAYAPGWSDERVAKESGMALAWVEARRAQDFGPLVKGPTLADARAELEALRGDIGAARLAVKSATEALLTLHSRQQKLAEMLVNVAAAADADGKAA